MQPWKTVSKRAILDQGKWLTVEEHTIELPDGRIKSDWPWINPVIDDLEEQEILLLQRDQVEAALAAGQFKLLSWAATMALALQHLKG